jgi:hypothetical protein
MTLATAGLTGGTATFDTSTLAAGTHTISASYGGDANFTGGSATLTQTVKGGTATTLTSSANPSTFGQSVTFTATVTPAAGTPGTPTGAVTFRDETSGMTLATVGLTGDTATYDPSALRVGTHTISASYGGDANFTDSSGIMTQVVAPNPTSVLLSSSPNPAMAGTLVALHATVIVTTSASGPAQGTVTFFDGPPQTGIFLGTVNLQGGAADLPVSLTPGSHFLTAWYYGFGVGEVQLAASVSGPVRQDVQMPPPPPLRSALLITRKVGKKRKLFVEITPGGGGPPVGILSPFQKPAFKGVKVTVNGAGQVVLTAKKGKRLVMAVLSG